MLYYICASSTRCKDWQLFRLLHSLEAAGVIVCRVNGLGSKLLKGVA